MKLTKKKVIEIAIELWTWLAETGAKDKGGWKGWEEYGEMLCECPFCEYGMRRAGTDGIERCNYCSYYGKFGACYLAGTPFYEWERAETKKDRKKYASEFLQQLLMLR